MGELLGPTGLKITRRPLLALDPGRLDASVFAQLDLRQMAPIDYLESAICRAHPVDGSEDGQVFDHLDVRVCVGVDVRVEATWQSISTLVISVSKDWD